MRYCGGCNTNDLEASREALRLTSDVVIDVRRFQWKYFGSSSWSVGGVTFTVRQGECVGIVGPTGAGKTTLLMALTGLIPHNFSGMMKGEILVDGRSTSATGVAQLAKSIGIVFEDAESQFVALSVEDDIAFGLENLNLPAAEVEERTKWAIGAVGLEGLESRNPLELSGGEKQRVAIAAVIATRPKILLLDEPTAELDSAGKRQVLDILNNLKANGIATLVIVDQDTELLAEVVDRMILIDEGKVALDESAESFFSRTQFLRAHSVMPLDVAELFCQLRLAGIRIERIPVTYDEAMELQERLLDR